MNADDTSALEKGQQVMALYFCAEVRDFDTGQMKVFDVLVQVREFDVLAEVKVFCTWVDGAELFQVAGQTSLIYEVSLVVFQWTLLYCSVYCLCSGLSSLHQGTQVSYQVQEWRDEKALEMVDYSCPRAEQQSKKSL